jgi:complement component 1 Q subcomponent-binding protein
MSAYNGPEFEDLEDKLQEAFDEYLGELGLNDAVFDFIDATAADKGLEEYIRWLDTIQKFLA